MDQYNGKTPIIHVAAKARRFGTAKGALQDKLIIIPCKIYIYLLKYTIPDLVAKFHPKLPLVVKYLLSLSWKMDHTTSRPSNLRSGSKALRLCKVTQKRRDYLSIGSENRLSFCVPLIQEESHSIISVSVPRLKLFCEFFLNDHNPRSIHYYWLYASSLTSLSRKKMIKG